MGQPSLIARARVSDASRCVQGVTRVRDDPESDAAAWVALVAFWLATGSFPPWQVQRGAEVDTRCLVILQ
jgi:hypothetical protein